jgi:hypothetical protein
MKKFLFYLLVLVVVGAAFYHYYPEQVESLLGKTPLGDVVATSKPVYQWQDERGQWHVTDKQPPEGVPYEVKQYPLDANVLPPFEEDKE